LATKKDNTKKKKINKTKTKTKKTKSKKTNEKPLLNEKKDVILYEIRLICLIAVTVLMILSFHTESVGLVGNYINSFFKGLFSNAAYIFPYLFFTVVFVSLNKNFKKYKFRYMIAFFLMLSAVLLYITVPTFDKATDIFNINYFSFEGIKKSYEFGIAGTGGGIVGNILTYLLYYLIGKIGIYLMILVNFVISILLITNYSIKTGFKTIKKKTDNFAESYEKKKINNKINVSNRKINHLKTESIRGIKKGFRVSSAEPANPKKAANKSEEKSQKETEDDLNSGIEIHDYVEKETEEKIAEPIEATKEEPIKKNEMVSKSKDEESSAEKKEVKKIKDSVVDYNENESL